MRRLVCVLMVLGAGCARQDGNSAAAKLEKDFEQALTGSVLVGKFQLGEKEHEDRYTITKASKLTGDIWTIHARIQYGSHDVTVPVPVHVQWAGDTPVIELTDAGIPGLGSYSARVLFYRGQYAGTWSNKEHGGQMWGRLKRAK